MRNILVIAPHPDDETLGCGGALLSHSAIGDRLHWLIFTKMSESSDYSQENVSRREQEIARVASLFGFASVTEYEYLSCSLDKVPMAEMVARLSADISRLKPEIIYIPHFGDVHSDHKVVYQAALSSIKWFRQSSVKIVRVYETLSETGMLGEATFSPNQYMDISEYLEKKLEIMRVYKSEMGEFPFPRSEESIRAIAQYRGTQSGYRSAEAFQLIFERL